VSIIVVNKKRRKELSRREATKPPPISCLLSGVYTTHSFSDSVFFCINVRILRMNDSRKRGISWEATNGTNGAQIHRKQLTVNGSAIDEF
jgi:hypothetical protein